MIFWASFAIVGTNLNASEKEKANSYGNFIDIKERAKLFGSTVKKKIENAETIMKILNIIARAKDKDMNKVFKTIIKMTKNDKPRMLLTHCLKIFPIITSGIRLKNIKNNGMIWLNNNPVIE